MIQCPQCGVLLQDNLEFCSKCGISIESEAVSRSPEVARIKIEPSYVFSAMGTIAMIVVAIGSALPWATSMFEAGRVGVGGLKSDGVATLVLSILGLGLFVFAIIGKKKFAFLIGSCLSISIFLITMYDAVHMGRILSGTAIDYTFMAVGIGLKICIIGAAVGIVSGIGGFLITRDSH